MKVCIFLTLFIAVLLGVNGRRDTQQIPGNYGITPLHSNRADVESRFGVSADLCHCVFQSSEGSVIVDYATAPCKGPLFGWNVPKDTVLAFRASPKVPPLLSEVAIDLAKFVKTGDQDDAVTVYYTNVLDGIEYAVQENHIVHIRYLPSGEDNGLRCKGFPIYDAGITEYTPFDSFIRRNEVATRARLDTFAVQLLDAVAWKGFVVAYAGRVTRKGEGREMSERARQYLIEKRNIPLNRIFAVDGGFRESPGYDLFLLRESMPAPTPTPTIPSNEVRIVGKTRKSSRRTLFPTLVKTISR